MGKSTAGGVPGDRQEVTVNIHHGPPDRSFGGEVERDAAVDRMGGEWTPEHITTYADGEEWYSTDRSGSSHRGP